MALLHPVEITETGVTASYWRITHVQADFTAGTLDAQLHGYLHQDARLDGRMPLSRMAFRFPVGSLVVGEAISLPAIYAAVRVAPAGQDEDGAAMPPLFAGATDI